VLDRIANPFDEGPTGGLAGASLGKSGTVGGIWTWGSWAQTFASLGHASGDGNSAEIDRSLDGFVLGLDATYAEHYRLGLTGGYTPSTASVEARDSSGQTGSIFGGLYGGASFKSLQMSGGALYASDVYTTDRSAVFPGFNEATNADYHGGLAQAFGEVGWRLPFSNLFASSWIEPVIDGLAARIDRNGFAETFGVSGLQSAAASYTVEATTLGILLLGSRSMPAAVVCVTISQDKVMLC
jgi:outer membrane autotransporter protein